MPADANFKSNPLDADAIGAGAAGPLAGATRAPSRVERVMDAVREHIRVESLLPGDELPGEAAFATRVGVSRPVAREAFRSLAALAVVDIGNGRRPRVARLDPDMLGHVIGHAVTTDQVSLQQIFDVRRTIERRIVALAARLASERERTAIRAEAQGMADAFAEPLRVREHDLAFHAHLARATRNPVFGLMVDGFAGVTRRTWEIAWHARPDDAERMRSIDTHLAIACAVAAGDAAEAVRRMDEHFDHSVKALLEAGVH